MRKLKKIGPALLRRMVEQLDASTTLAPISGGTMSSHQLRAALELFSRPEVKKTPKYYRRVLRIIQIWREAVIRHNAQPTKLITYNVQTGQPIMMSPRLPRTQVAHEGE